MSLTAERPLTSAAAVLSLDLVSVPRPDARVVRSDGVAVRLHLDPGCDDTKDVGDAYRRAGLWPCDIRAGQPATTTVITMAQGGK